MRITKLLAAALAALSLGGCAYHGGPGHYRGYDMGEQQVRFGVVDSVREVRLHARETGIGATSGMAIGSIAGSHAGRGYHSSVAGAIGGAILGAIVGSEIERSANERPGVEVTVLLDSGRYLAVVQEGAESFRAGDRVRVLSSRGSTRVTH